MAKVRSLMMIIDNDITVMVHGDSIFLARWSTTDDDDIAHISQHRSGVLISSIENAITVANLRTF